MVDLEVLLGARHCAAGGADGGAVVVGVVRVLVPVAVVVAAAGGAGAADADADAALVAAVAVDVAAAAAAAAAAAVVFLAAGEVDSVSTAPGLIHRAQQVERRRASRARVLEVYSRALRVSAGRDPFLLCFKGASNATLEIAVAVGADRHGTGKTIRKRGTQPAACRAESGELRAESRKARADI
jgi:hypothetical protein